MTLIIASSEIIHPDTLNYHIENILWMQQFKAVPGVVHTGIHAGFQSFWFASNAVFQTNIGKGFPIFLNGAVLTWFFIFLLNKIKLKQENLAQIGYFLILLFTLISWTQVRLTAASASPDFIIAIYILAAGYIWLNNKTSPNDLIIILATTAVAIKLSALPVLILPLYIIFSKGFRVNYKKRAFLLLLILLIIFPILVRNAISSGYILYPSSFPDIVNPSWKINTQVLDEVRHYIKEYARLGDDNAMQNDKQWIYQWWNHLYYADRVLIASILGIFIFNLLFSRKLIGDFSLKYWILFLTSAIAILYWFIMAPDPRFATGFLLLFLLLLIHPLSQKVNVKLIITSLKIMVWLLSISVVIYSGYRVIRYDEANQIVYPKGVKRGLYTSINCNNIKVNIPLTDSICGAIPVPCFTSPCKLEPLGNKITDGFRK